MTTEHALIAALSTLLIAGLLIYLRGMFRKPKNDQYINDNGAWRPNPDYQPKRRKYRDKL